MSKLKIRASNEEKGVIFLFIILAILVGVSIYLLTSLKTDVVATQISNDQVLRTLFVVPESKKDNGADGGSALLTFILVYYPVSKRALVINVPGSTGSIWPSIARVDRINAVYKERGIKAYTKEIETLLGITIPFSVVIEKDNFSRLTDLFNGVRVFIPTPVDLTQDGERVLLPSGSVTLDGDKVLTYLEYSDPSDTFSDMQARYQDIECGFLCALCEKRTVYFTKKSIFGQLSKLFSTNLKHKEDAFSLFSLISGLDAETLGRLTITGRLRSLDVGTLLFPLNNGDFIKEAVKQNINMLVSNAGTASARIYVLEIKNGTKIQGLAHNTSILYQNASYDVLATSNADREYEKTVIIDRIGNAEMAKMVGAFINCDNIEEEQLDPQTIDITDAAMTNVADVDFTIILGSDFDGRRVRK